MNEPKPLPRDIMSETLVERLLSGKPTPLEREAAEALTQAQARCAEVEKDAARWRQGVCKLYPPEFCGHDDEAPKGSGWYHQNLPGKWFDTPDEAIDAAIDAALREPL